MCRRVFCYKKGTTLLGLSMVFLILLILLFFPRRIQGQEKVPYWRFDSMASCQNLEDLRNYRKCTEPVKLSQNEQEKEKDYKKLLVSGSGQLPFDTYTLLYQDLKQDAPEDSSIYMVDLRQESHGYLDQYSVSLHGKDHNDINRGLMTFQVIAKEALDMQSLYKVNREIRSGGTSVTRMPTMNVCSDEIEMEKDLAEEAGFIYIRFACQDHHFPQKETVDEFISFYRQLPRNAWLHFHCLAGRGRTSVFMIMYDLLRHPYLTMKKAANRQYMIGGKRIVTSSGKEDWSGKYSDNDRSKSLRLFRKYVAANHKNNYETPYSQWLETRQ